MTILKKPYILLIGIIYIFSMQSYLFSQQEMFDDFNYDNSSDPALYEINKWIVINGESGPPSGGIYDKNNITFYADPQASGNMLMGVSTTATNVSSATRHSRIETDEMPYLYGTYASLIYLDDSPAQFGDGNVETFYTIGNYSTCSQANLYSEVDFEYLPYDLWGNKDKAMYLTSWETCDLGQRDYTALKQSFSGWHIFMYTYIQGQPVTFYMDSQLIGTLNGSYPDSYQNISFANWIVDNVVGTNTELRKATMQVDWVYYAKDMLLSPEEVQQKVNSFRGNGIIRQNLSGQQEVTDECFPSILTPFTSIDGGDWQQITDILLPEGSTFVLAPQPTEGTWSWSGPNQFTSDERVVTVQNVSVSNSGNYTGTYINECGSSSTISYNIIVNGSNNGVSGLNGTYVLENRKSGLVMDVAYGDLANGTNILQYYNTGETNQQFMLDEISNGVYTLTCKATDKVVEVEGANMDDLANVWQWEYTEEPNQQFIVEAADEGYYKLRANHSNKIIEVGYASTAPNANINQYTDNNQICGQWKLIPVVPSTWSVFLEAEDYDNQSGTQVEDCSEGGQNVGYIDAGDWLAYYNIDFPETGEYTVEYRVASLNGSELSLDLNAGTILLGSVNIPSTDGWQIWITVEQTVFIEAGIYNLGIYAPVAGTNINWIQLTQGLKSTPEILPENANSTEISLFPVPAKDILNVKQKEGTGHLDLKILELSGRLVYESGFTHKTSIDISSFNRGLYVVKVVGESINKTLPLVIE